MPKRIPITTAKSVAEKHDLRQVLLIGWDGDLTHVVTYGKTKADCAAAAKAQDFWTGRIREFSFSDLPPARLAAIRAFATERARQVSAEGWTEDHDDDHATGELALAAAAYAAHAAGGSRGPIEAWIRESIGRLWPWSARWWKPAGPMRDLEKAGALLIAEYERLERAKVRGEAGQ